MSKRATRRTEHAFVAEGCELLRSALDAGAEIEAIFIAPEGLDDPEVIELSKRSLDTGARVYGLEPGVMERVSDTVTPQPVLSVVKTIDADIEVVAKSRLVIVLVDVRDPGNAGTVMRTVDASGAAAVIFCGGTVDPYNPKTVRASAGSIFHVPVILAESAREILDKLSEFGYQVFGTDAHGEIDYVEVDWTRPTALVLGNEANGLSDQLVELLDATISIPMVGKAESLNVGIACAVLCFEALRRVSRRCERID